jgi:superfamily II DNA helicase RecQ
VVAETTQEDIRVHLAAAFEGYFDLQTTFNRAEIKVDDHVADPAKQDRERIVTHAAQRGGIVGAAAWVPGRKSAPKGSAKVKTVNGRATLNI